MWACCAAAKKKVGEDIWSAQVMGRNCLQSLPEYTQDAFNCSSWTVFIYEILGGRVESPTWLIIGLLWERKLTTQAASKRSSMNLKVKTKRQRPQVGIHFLWYRLVSFDGFVRKRDIYYAVVTWLLNTPPETLTLSTRPYSAVLLSVPVQQRVLHDRKCPHLIGQLCHLWRSSQQSQFVRPLHRSAIQQGNARIEVNRWCSSRLLRNFLQRRNGSFLPARISAPAEQYKIG